MDNAKIYLCKADRSILGTLTGIKSDTCNLTKNATDYWEITFEVERFIERNGILVQSDYYDSVDEMMKLYLDSDEDQVFFVIDSEPVINGESYQETKTVTAHSIECELNDIYLSNFKINCGTYDSQEYLVTDDNGKFNNIDDYTGLPKEYISLVNYDNNQLSLMHLALQGTDWTVKDGIDPNVCSIKKSFESSDSIYSFFMKTVSSAASVIFEFDRKHKQIGIVKVENYGEDTGIFVTMRNLMNSFEITSSSQDAIMTKLVPTGANNLGIEQVNFGKDYIINLDYFMNTLNEYGDYKFVSTELHDKYNTWKNYRETEKITYNGKEYTRRELYIELTKLYNKTMLEINELHNRLPNDGCVIDYKTFSLEELKVSLNAYNKALVSLITIYKNEYGVTAIGNAPDYSPTPSTATNIKDTPYWYDFYAYKEKIIPQVEQALKLYCKTDSNGNLMTDSDGNFIELEFGNPDYYADETIVKNIDDYLYEWSLYGLDELESKKKAWGECANVLYNECFIASGTPSSPVYRTADNNGWSSLTDSQKKEFTSKDAFISKLNQYLDYMSFDTSRNNSLTKKKGKGIIRQCEDAITKRKNEIVNIEIKQNQYNSQRAEIANSVTLENFKVNGTLLFTEKELNIIKSMTRTQDYSNEYILTTNLDDVVSTVDIQEELYQDAVTKLYEISQPQYSFSTELDNLYYLEEFKSYREPFEVGNFIRAGLEIHEDLYDNNFVKLRLISISYNPLESSEDLSVGFSTMTKSLDGISDLAFLLDKESSSGSTSSGGSSSSSGGTYGDNDANVQISNNMLNALLKTEMFGTTVTDVILDSMKANKGNFNTLFAHSGVFSSLEAGRIKVSGDCLFDRIKSSNWNGTESNLIDNTVGSAMDLSTGKFNFAGGKLKWDGNNFTLIADSFSLSSGKTISDIAEDEVNDFINNVYKKQINNLQAQIDGQIETWYYDYEPTLTNLPASSWTDDTIKTKHEGDLFYWKSKGFAYRFFKDNNTWKWQLVQDTDITKALANAAQAQDTADSKRRIFITTPTPPYDVGDLWTQGENGDIMTCVVARNSGNYNSSDWQKRNKYIDVDTAQSEAKDAVDAQTQEDIFNKLTNNGETQGIYLQDNKLYINATYIHGGTLTLGGLNNTNGLLRVLDSSGNEIGSWSKDGIVTNSLTLGNDVKINTSNISGLSTVATSGSYSDLSGRPTIPTNVTDLTGGINILYTTDVTVGTSTTSNGISKQTITVGDDSFTFIDGGDFVLTNIGLGSDKDGSNYAYISKEGLLKARNATIYGTIYATNGSFAGDVVANTLTANKSGTIAGWTFDENGFYKNSNVIGNKNGFYIGDDGISIGNYFVINADGATMLNKDYQNAVYETSIDFDSIPISNNEQSKINIKLSNDNTSFALNIEYKAYGTVKMTSSLGTTTTTGYINCSIHIVFHKNDNEDFYFDYGMDAYIKSCLLNDTECDIEINCVELNSCNHSLNGYNYSSYSATWDREIPIEITNINCSNNVQVKNVYFYDEDNLQDTFIKGIVLQRLSGLLIDTPNKMIYGDDFELNSNSINGYNDFNYRIYSDYNNTSDIFRINKSEIYHNGLSTSTTGDNLIISNGAFYQKSSSSQRYKNSIQSISDNLISKLSPSNLYDIDIVTFKYNDDYLLPNDQRYQKNIPGFIAEDVYEKYPIACNLDKDGNPEMWDINIMFPAALALIQEQHRDIELLKEEIEKMKSN